ncbi:cysteine rich repeat-containing domain protein [Cooperia oncophora]
MKKCTELTQPGYALSCLLDFTPNVTATSQCHAFLQRTAVLAFADFRLIGPFVEKCGATVSRLGCGTLTPHKAHDGVRVPHTQGMALECLISNVVKHGKDQSDPLQMLDVGCRHEVMRLVEMQTEDFHLDRPLFFACRQDRERICKDVQAGQGKVFECLMMNRFDQFMEPECSRILAERAYMMGRNYRMAHPLVKACENEMKEYKCEPQDEYEAAAHYHLTWILLCLENGAHNAKGNDKIPSPQCQHEMLTHRQMMVAEFHMAPEVVLHCAQEIDKWCSPRGDIEPKGLTLHCLMEHASATDKTKQVGPQCMQALKDVVKVADIGSNYKVDKVLYGSCRSLIDGACARETGSEADTLNCLMRHVDSSDMTMMCEQRLLEVQYFMARDWTLDPQLYEACHDEAVGDVMHHRIGIWRALDQIQVHQFSHLSKKCGVEVRRVLHTRAVRVNLIPDIEDACREALSEYCSNNVKPMEEMTCLQDNFEKKEFIKRHPICHKEITRFTEMESKDTKLNRALTKACKPVIKAHCEQFANEEIDHGDVMECLLNNKDQPEMTSKCRSYVNHFELISLRDYHFSYKFEKACSADIDKHCPDHGNDKGEIIRCLSEVRFEHKVLGTTADLSEPCKHQLKVAYLQQEQVEGNDKIPSPQCQHEMLTHRQMMVAEFHMAPEVVLHCAQEIDKWCSPRGDIEPKGLTLHCLMEHASVADIGSNYKVDKVLYGSCRSLIDGACARETGSEADTLNCLMRHVDSSDMTMMCEQRLLEVQYFMARDWTLDPQLYEACHDEAVRRYDPGFSYYFLLKAGLAIEVPQNNLK